MNSVLLFLKMNHVISMEICVLYEYVAVTLSAYTHNYTNSH